MLHQVMAVLSLVAAPTAPGVADRPSALPRIVNGGFEQGGAGWLAADSAVFCDDSTCGVGAAAGTHYAHLGASAAGTYVEQDVVVPPGRLLEFRVQKFACAAGHLRVTFATAAGTTSLLAESMLNGCTGVYEARRLVLPDLEGSTGRLRIALTSSALEPPEALVDEVALVPPTIKGDLDGDRRSDLVFGRHDDLSGCWTYIEWLMSEAVQVGVSTQLSNSCQLGIKGLDDFDADGHTDLALTMFNYDDATIWTELIYLNGLSPTGSHWVATSEPLDPYWSLAATADFSNDGIPDLLWRNALTQELRIWILSAAGDRASTVSPIPNHAVDSNWQVVVAQDLDGDSATDLLWYNVTSGKIVLWLMDLSASRITGRFAVPANAGDSNWKVVAAGDFGTGPGGAWNATDLLWRNETSGKLVAWFMDQTGTRTSGTFVSPADSPTGYVVLGPR